MMSAGSPPSFRCYDADAVGGELGSRTTDGYANDYW